MRFLVDASLPRAAATRLMQLGHDAEDVRDLGLSDAADTEIARFAREQKSVLVTGDFDFADVRNYPPEAYAGIIVIHAPGNPTTANLLRLLAAFVSQDEWMSRLNGRLAIVEQTRVRFRPS